MNDDIDADAKALISDAERYLRGPPLPPDDGSTNWPTGLGSNTRTASARSRGQDMRDIRVGAGFRASTANARSHGHGQLNGFAARGRDVVEGSSRSSAKGVAPALGARQRHGKQSRRNGQDPADAAAISPLLRLKERVEGSATASQASNHNLDGSLWQSKAAASVGSAVAVRICRCTAYAYQ